MRSAAVSLRAVGLRVVELAPEPLFAEPDFVWRGRDGRAITAVGEALRIDADGPDRLLRVREAAEALWNRMPGDVEPPPLVGGLAFAPGFRDEAWRGFADASFVLPRWTWLREADGRERLLAVVEDGDGLPARPPAAAAHEPPRVACVVFGDEGEYVRRVQEILALIRAGAVHKIVAARRTQVDLVAPVSPAAVLERLVAAGGETTRFLVRRGGTTFIGASPERLVARRGLDVVTEALAGSAAPASDGGALLGSGKDRGEHALVVGALVRALAPVCARLVVPEAPELRALRDVLHLRTPLTGRLAAPLHVLDLVAALHPTPAVAGVPVARAVDFVRAHEPARGWYAGAVGWFDRAGDGDFAVALRAGVIAGRHALTWAGAGIVAGSAPAAEWAETGWKQQAFLAALGGGG